MPPWNPTQTWKDQDVFIIGGGSSLRTFDFSLLLNEWTIGCNSAFTLGKEICNICIFGDAKWFEVYQHDLKQYDGVLFTSAPKLRKTRLPWLWTMSREPKGLHHHALGWNKNTGASAINLALLLGARRIFLLGYDMHLSLEGKPNWHDRLIHKPCAGNYNKFTEGFIYVQRDLKAKWPDVRVFNITDDSELNCFPKISVKEFWSNRKAE